MRLFLILLCLLTILGSDTLLAQSATTERFIRDFIQEHRKGPENFAIKVPGWMAGLTSEIGYLTTSDAEERAAYRILGDIGTTRVLTFIRDDFADPTENIENFLYSLENYHGYERWTSVRTSTGEQIHLSVHYARRKIRNMVVVVEEEDRSVMVAAKTNLSADELGDLLNEIEAR